MSNRLTYFSLGLTILLAIVKIIQAKHVSLKREAEAFLSQYNNFPASIRNTGSEEVVIEVVKRFQTSAGLDANGYLKNMTVELMSRPRCGVQDVDDFRKPHRSKRYVLHGGTWPSKDLTYKILNYPSVLHMRTDDIDAEIARAFSVWSEYTDLTFTPSKSDKVDIEIKFVAGDHGDGATFDEEGGVVAHAFSPEGGGATHFDDDEEWTMSTNKGSNLFQTAVHEFGHALGLSHSDVSEAVMAPLYREYQPDFKLHPDDIAGIQALYGKKSNGPSREHPDDIAGIQALYGKKSSGPSQEHPDDIAGIQALYGKKSRGPSREHPACKNPKVDAMFDSPNGETHVFQGHFYYKVKGQAVVDGYPKLISQEWPGISGNIDTAFANSRGEIYFFKGSKYWRFHGHRMDAEYPKTIRRSFRMIPDNLDVVTIDRHGRFLYFFKDNLYWTMEIGLLKFSNPMPVHFLGLPNNLDAVYQHKSGALYFFKDDLYYQINDITNGNQVARLIVGASIKQLLGCGSANRQSRTT